MENLQLLQRALGEIKALRNQNRLMSARLEMFDNMMCLLHSEPVKSSGQRMAHPDIAYELEKAIQDKPQQ